MIERTTAVTDAGSGPNEDTVGHTIGGGWVFDGATGIAGPTRTPARSDARWYAHTLERATSERIETDAPLASVAADAIRTVRAAYRTFDGDFPPARVARPSAAGAILRWRSDELELFVLADCTAVVRTTDGCVSTVTDDRLQPFETEAIEAAHDLVQGGLDIEAAREAILPKLRETRSLLNTPDGYWAFGLTPNAADNGITTTVDRGAVDDVLVCSDGFAAAVDTYDCVPDWESLVSAAATDGPGAVVDRIRATERRDPECRRHPRLKPADDATALYLEFG